MKNFHKYDRNEFNGESGVALIADRLLQSGAVCNGAELSPNYLRLSQAERERLEKAKGEA